MTTASLKVPFLEYSSFTLAIEPVLVQVMVWAVPTPHFSPPLGAVTVREPTILKFASEVSATVASAVLVTRTLTVELILSGTVHAYVPAAASVDAVITEAVAKLSVEYSSLTVANLPAVGGRQGQGALDREVGIRGVADRRVTRIRDPDPDGRGDGVRDQPGVA